MSSILEATKALVEVAKHADYGDLAPQVSYFVDRNLETLVVAIGGGNGSEEWGAIGDRRRDEEYAIDFFVGAAWPGDSAEEARDRAWAVFAAFEEAVRENHATVREDSSKGVLFSQIGNLQWGPTIEDQGYGHTINGSVRFNGTT